MDGDRHQTAEQLHFLKQAYKKNEKFERGGHTLDLMNGEVMNRFGKWEPRAFKEAHEKGLEQVRKGFARQRKVQADEFIQAERERLAAIGVDSGVNQKRFGSTTREGKIEEEEKEETHQNSGRGNKVKLEAYNTLKAELDKVHASLKRYGKKGHEKKSAKGNKGKKPRRKKAFNAHEQRMQQRSELEKKAAAIPKEVSYKFHIDSQYTSMHKKDFQEAENDFPVEEKHKMRGLRMSRYADAIAKSPDLRMAAMNDY